MAVLAAAAAEEDPESRDLVGAGLETVDLVAFEIEVVAAAVEVVEWVAERREASEAACRTCQADMPMAGRIRIRAMPSVADQAAGPRHQVERRVA